MASLPPLHAGDFAEFFREVHGFDPFPWQARLAQTVDAEGWPRVIDIPTGCGKTAVVDVAVFSLALEAGRPERRMPLRIVYVVDRRTIVDQAYDHADGISRALGEATSGVLGSVRRRLESLGGEGVALRTALLRGAIARNDMWARCPDQPLVAVSTVDQVGSRILFRGYGVSDSMKPIHAGLLGNDTLYLLDEVHLSQPFRDTLGAIRDRYAGWRQTEVGRPIELVEMSATPGDDADAAFGLDGTDRDNEVLVRRLGASKPTTIDETTDGRFQAEVLKRIAEMWSEERRTLAAVVNRVATAREVAGALRETKDPPEVYLLTGRMRPLDRERVENQLLGRVRSGRERDGSANPTVVVATQCIEAGADFDFDGLVTECASLDALRQRFGRLDRLGELAGEARGAVVARKGSLKEDPIYGEALGKTREYLSGLVSLDFGIDALPLPVAAELAPMTAPRPRAPTLLPSHLDILAQTSPRPSEEPDISLWLHGPARGAVDVQVVWRADLEAGVLRSAADADASAANREAAQELALGCVEALPPSSGEALPVPIYAVRRWLSGQSESEVSDVEGASEEPDSGRKDTDVSSEPRPCLAWRGEDSRIIGPRELRPGDTIVVPASYGGIEDGTWAPEATDEVSDLAEIATLRQRGRAHLRLHEVSLAGKGINRVPPVPSSLAATEEPDDAGVVEAWLAAVVADGHEGDVGHLVGLLEQAASSGNLRIERMPRGLEEGAGDYFLLTVRGRVPAQGDEISTEDDQASFTGKAVRLEDHLRGVGRVARSFADRIGLGPEILSDIELAGNWHDAGKIDPRFQRLLHGGSEYRALIAPAPLAKSATVLRDPRSRSRARERSGYPTGTRHELLSLALMEAGGDALQRSAADWDLVLHLVASHHGRCRPLAPWVEDPAPRSVSWEFGGITAECSTDHSYARLDSGVGDRFWMLIRRYGWWGLAWLETILRLGDHRRSEQEQAGKD